MARHYRYFRKDLTDAVKGVKKWIDDNPTNGNSTAILAGEASISRNVLQDVFKYQYGSPIGQYKLRVRMAYSKELLVTKRSIKEVTFLLQYSSVSAFTNAFSKYFGQSPSDWRIRRTVS